MAYNDDWSVVYQREIKNQVSKRYEKNTGKKLTPKQYENCSYVVSVYGVKSMSNIIDAYEEYKANKEW